MINKETLSALIDAIQNKQVSDQAIIKYFMINHSELFVDAINVLKKEQQEEEKRKQNITSWVYEVVNLASSGKIIPAIKCLRENTGFGLKESKDVIDYFDASKEYSWQSLNPNQVKILDLLVAAKEMLQK